MLILKVAQYLGFVVVAQTDTVPLLTQWEINAKLFVQDAFCGMSNIENSEEQWKTPVLLDLKHCVGQQPHHGTDNLNVISFPTHQNGFLHFGHFGVHSAESVSGI